jgi:hypothetical protein
MKADKAVKTLACIEKENNQGITVSELDDFHETKTCAMFNPIE